MRALRYQETIYSRLSLEAIYKCHNKYYVLASLELLHRGLIPEITFRTMYAGMPRQVIDNAYKLAEKRGY